MSAHVFQDMKEMVVWMHCVFKHVTMVDTARHRIHVLVRRDGLIQIVLLQFACKHVVMDEIVQLRTCARVLRIGRELIAARLCVNKVVLMAAHVLHQIHASVLQIGVVTTVPNPYVIKVFFKHRIRNPITIMTIPIGLNIDRATLAHGARRLEHLSATSLTW